MEQVIVVDDKLKKAVGVVCFIPAVCFGISLAYYLLLLYPLTQGHPQPKSVVGITSDNYSTLLIMLAISATVSACVLIYCLIHIVKLRTLNAPVKMMWALLLVGLVPFSFILFWFFQFRKEQKYTPIYSDIS